MAKRKTSIFIVLPLTIGLLFLLFTYLSLLGENDRISNVIEEFFATIRDHNYPQTFEHLSRDLRNDIGADEEQFFETCFLLELALLKKYDLLEQDNYHMKFQAAHLWIPYLQDSTIPVSVSAKKNEPKKLAELLGSAEEQDFVDNLFTVTRQDGFWKIMSINYADSSIAETFTNLKREVKLDQYLQKTPEGFRVSSFTVRTEGMTPIESRRLSFIIHKVLRYLGEDVSSKTDNDTHPY